MILKELKSIMTTTIDDDALVAMLKDPAQKEQAYRILMKQYGSKLYWNIRRIVVSHDDAEDALQETAINIYTGIADFNGKSSLSTWIFRIAINEALRVLRKRTTIFQSIDSIGESLVEKIEAETPLDAHSAEVLFQRALLTLPTQQRIAFNLRYYDELPYEQISQITGKSVNSLKTNYHFAVTKIKDFFKEQSI